QSRTHMDCLLKRLRNVLSFLNVEIKSWNPPSTLLCYLGLELDCRRKRWRLKLDWAAKASTLLLVLSDAHPRETIVPLRLWWKAIGYAVFAFSVSPRGLTELTDLIRWASCMARRVSEGKISWST